MINCICNILSIFLISLWPTFIQTPTSNQDSVCLQEIDLTNNPNLFTVLTRVVKEAKGITNNGVNYLTVELLNDTCGIRMKVVAHVRKSLARYDKYGGFSIVEGKPVIFENQSKVQLQEASQSKGVFPMSKNFDPPIIYDPDEWLFILKKKSYARFFEGRGWIWFQYDY